MSRPRCLVPFVAAAAVSAAFLISVWSLLGRDAAEKIGTALFMPSGLLWILLIILAVQLFPRPFARERSVGAFTALTALILYTVAGNGLVAEHLAAQLEAPYVNVNPLEADLPEVVIVLGGGGGPAANGRQQGNGSGDRLILAAQLYHRKPSIQFICTGKRIDSMNASGVDPAETSQDILIRLGVPPDSISLTGGKNTSEEMKNLAESYAGKTQRFGILTSAWHLPRAMRLAARNGITAEPLPADFRSAPRDIPFTTGQYLEAMIPNGGAFGSIWQFTKEYLGMLIGR